MVIKSLVVTCIPRFLPGGEIDEVTRIVGRFVHGCPLARVSWPQSLRTVNLEHKSPRPGLCLLHGFKITKAVSVASWRWWCV